MALELTSPAFERGGEIPKKHTCDGDNVSPPLRWRGTPDDARSLVLLCNDPDAPGGAFRHWAAYDITADRLEMAEARSPGTEVDGFRQAVNDFGDPGYGGPVRPRAADCTITISA